MAAAEEGRVSPAAAGGAFSWEIVGFGEPGGKGGDGMGGGNRDRDREQRRKGDETILS